MCAIFIPKNVPSSKNSKQWTGKYLVHSKTVRNYIKETKVDWIKNKQKFLQLIKDKQKPYNIKFTFIRDTKRKFDYINPCQTIQDLEKFWHESPKWQQEDPDFKKLINHRKKELS